MLNGICKRLEEGLGELVFNKCGVLVGKMKSSGDGQLNNSVNVLNALEMTQMATLLYIFYHN